MVAHNPGIDFMNRVFQYLLNNEGDTEGVDLSHEIAETLKSPTDLTNPGFCCHWRDIIVDLVKRKTKISNEHELE
jgi:hypothetical protein